MKCAFVGISNWALDPAKMNRGIFVQRGTPKSKELKQIAKYEFHLLYLTSTPTVLLFMTVYCYAFI